MATAVDELLSNVERDFILRALKEQQRVDGRQMLEPRPISMYFSRTEAQTYTEVQWGRTRIGTVITADVVKPYPDRPTEGFVQFNVEFTRMASETFESHRQVPMIAELTRVLERLFRESKAIDTEALCIIAGEKAWSIRINVHVLDHAGNLMDAAAFAVIAGLLHFRRSEVSVSGEEVVIHTMEERAPVPLSIHHIPVCLTFALFPDSSEVVLDPSDREELVATGTLTFGMNAHNEVCCVHKLGGTAIKPATLIRCARIAAKKGAELCNLLDSFLKRAKVVEEGREAERHAAAAGFRKPQVMHVTGEEGKDVEMIESTADVPETAVELSTQARQRLATSMTGIKGELEGEEAEVKDAEATWSQSEDENEDGDSSSEEEDEDMEGGDEDGDSQLSESDVESRKHEFDEALKEFHKLKGQPKAEIVMAGADRLMEIDDGNEVKLQDHMKGSKKSRKGKGSRRGKSGGKR